MKKSHRILFGAKHVISPEEIVPITDQRDRDEFNFRKQEKNIQPLRDELFSVNPKFNGVYTEMVGMPEFGVTGKYFKRVNGKRVYVNKNTQIK